MHRLIAVIVLAFSTGTVQGDEWARILPVGADVPEIEATDQYGNNWNNRSLAGEHGYILFFNRSTVW